MRFSVECVRSNDGQYIVDNYGDALSYFDLRLEEQRGINMFNNHPYFWTYATIELDSIEDLKHLCEKVGYPIIVSNEPSPRTNGPYIEIYDDYRE